MKYLIDANVWLQPIFRLAHSAEVVRMLAETPRGRLTVEQVLAEQSL